MVTTEPTTYPQTWSDPEHCPFCEAELEDGGPGFISHIEESPICERGFELWRRRIVGDMSGEWIG